MTARGLKRLTLAELQRELRRRERGNGRRANALIRKREGLVKKLAAVDAELARLGLSGRKNGRTRPRNESNLADALVKLLTGRTMNVTKIASAVQEAGYQTTSPNFRTIVNQTLIKDRRIKRVGRGEYTAK